MKKNPWIIASLLMWSMNSSVVSAQTVTKVETLKDLKAVQGQIQKVVKKVRPATVALTSTRSGASGSGVIVSNEGLILTAAHVVQGDKQMSVIFPDGRAYVANVLGANRTKDVAMLKLVRKKDWPFAEIGDSDALKVGSYVVAMGHAGGFDTRRPAPVRFGRLISKKKKGFISSDSVLIGGDSGGPLFDLNGKVVGINSSIGKSRMTNNHAGISSLVEDWERLLKGDTWGQLNQNTNPLADPDSPVMGFKFEETNNNGVAVMKVLDNSPAKKAGFKEGDVLVAIGDEKIKNGRDLLVVLNYHNANDKVEVTLMRAEKKIKLGITLTRRGDLSNK